MDSAKLPPTLPQGTIWQLSSATSPSHYFRPIPTPSHTHSLCIKPPGHGLKTEAERKQFLELFARRLPREIRDMIYAKVPESLDRREDRWRLETMYCIRLPTLKTNGAEEHAVKVQQVQGELDAVETAPPPSSFLPPNSWLLHIFPPCSSNSVNLLSEFVSIFYKTSHFTIVNPHVGSFAQFMARDFLFGTSVQPITQIRNLTLELGLFDAKPSTSTSDNDTITSESDDDPAFKAFLHTLHFLADHPLPTRRNLTISLQRVHDWPTPLYLDQFIRRIASVVEELWQGGTKVRLVCLYLNGDEGEEEVAAGEESEERPWWMMQGVTVLGPGKLGRWGYGGE